MRLVLDVLGDDLVGHATLPTLAPLPGVRVSMHVHDSHYQDGLRSISIEHPVGESRHDGSADIQVDHRVEAGILADSVQEHAYRFDEASTSPRGLAVIPVYRLPELVLGQRGDV